MKSLEQEFWSKVDKKGPLDCWERSTGKRGSYSFVGGSGGLAHRFSWKLHYGPIPKRTGKRELFVCHHCDNPPCVNPAHLFLGTCKDNVRDMVVKNGGGRGYMRFEAKIPKREGRILWRHLFDHELTFTAWLRKQILKMNGKTKN